MISAVDYAAFMAGAAALHAAMEAFLADIPMSWIPMEVNP